MTWVKICGITRIEDAEAALAAGADAIGLNFVPSSPRALSAEVARGIIEAMHGRIEVVGVIVDLSIEQARSLGLGLDRWQLHGSESPEMLAEFPNAYKALRIGNAADVEAAELYAGDRLLIDAKVEGELGGTGQRVNLDLVRELATRRPIVLAGGLTPENVGAALQEIPAFGVDVASGVEARAGIKDAERVFAFVRAVRSVA